MSRSLTKLLPAPLLMQRNRRRLVTMMAAGAGAVIRPADRPVLLAPLLQSREITQAMGTITGQAMALTPLRVRPARRTKRWPISRIKLSA